MTTEVACGMTSDMDLPKWDTVADRLLHALDVYKKRTAGKISDRELSRQIFGEENGSRIGTLKTRFAAGSDGQDLPGTTLAAFAERLEVDLDWLSRGKGWPDEQTRKAFEGKTPVRRSSSSDRMKAVKPDK